MSTCEAWARLHEGDVQFDVECDREVDAAEHGVDRALGAWSIHHDPELGDWDGGAGLHDRSLTPTETRLKR